MICKVCKAEEHTNPDCYLFRVRTTKEEVEQLMRFMQTNWSKQSPAPHTAGKAHCYLGQLLKQDLADKQLVWKTSRFVDGCRGVTSGRLPWEELSSIMRGWF